METGLLYPALGEFVAQDALAELRNHADALEASAQDDEDVRRSVEVRKQADELGSSQHTSFT